MKIADSQQALTLHEAKYGPVHYIPRTDVDMTKLVSTEHSTYCPYKGDCSYFTIIVANEQSTNAVWSYEKAFPAVGQIEGYMAFYPERVDSITLSDDA